MMRFTAYLSLVLLPLTAAGCADEGDIEDCIGLSCPNGFQWPFGGELRVWYIELPDGTQLRRFIGFFTDSGTPDILPSPEIGYCAPDLSSTPGFGFSPDAGYIDVGESITFDVGDQQVEVPRLVAEGGEKVIDFAGRPHDIAYLHEIVVPVEGEAFFDANHKITTAEQMDFSSQIESPGIYMPPDFDVIRPEGNPVITLRDYEDTIVEWRNLKEPDPDIATGGAIVLLPDPNPDGTPNQPYACIVPNNGEMTIPKETIEALGADTGVMVIGTASNESVVRPDGRFQSMFGMNCHLNPWQRVSQ